MNLGIWSMYNLIELNIKYYARMNSSQTLPFVAADALKTNEVAAGTFLGGASSAASFNVEHELAARLALNHGGKGGGGHRIKNARINDNDNSDTPSNSKSLLRKIQNSNFIQLS